MTLAHQTFDALTCHAKTVSCRRIRLSRIFDRFDRVRTTAESERQPDGFAVANIDIDTGADFHSYANTDADRGGDADHNAKWRRYRLGSVYLIDAAERITVAFRDANWDSSGGLGAGVSG